MRVWRIATDTPTYTADDLRGLGAKTTGGRWSRAGAPLVYCAESISLAALETLVHLGAGGLPLNRYLVSVEISEAIWRRRQILPLGACRTLVVDSENRPQRGHFLPDSPPHGCSMGQEAGEKGSAAVDLQPTIPKSDRLLETAPVGWDALPTGKVSLDFGDAWLTSLASAVLVVPSIVVPEESNILINPLHQDASGLSATKLRKWRYDERLLA